MNQEQTEVSVSVISSLAAESDGIAQTAHQVGRQLKLILDDAVTTETRLQTIAPMRDKQSTRPTPSLVMHNRATRTWVLLGRVGQGRH